MESFRIGIIGSGRITESGHLPGALASRKVTIAALVDPVFERTESLARDYGVDARLATDLDEIVDDVDGVIIAAPNHVHRPLALKCAERGLHALIEKPLATTVAACDEILAATQKAGITVAVGYTTRARDEVVVLHDMFRDGFLGRIHRFVYQSGSVGGWSPLSAYNLSKSATGGGVLVVTGAHFLDRMLYWFGYPNEVEFEDDSHGGPEAHCVARMRFESGIEGLVRLSKTVKLTPGFAMETERGTVLLPTRHPAPLLFRPFGHSSLELVLKPRGTTHFPPDTDEFTIQIDRWVDACRGAGTPIVDGPQARESVRLIEDLYAHRRAVAEDWHVPAQEVTV